MTSKTSLYKHLKNDIRHRIWVPALSCVVFLLGLVAVIMYAQSLSITLQAYDYTVNRAQVIASFARVFGIQNFLLLIVSITGATICGLEGFSHLFSRRRTDFYHALPLTRKQVFFLRWFNGILFFVIPYLIFLVLSTIVGGLLGLNSAAFYINIWIGFAYNLLTFLVFYHSAILAAMLTGQLLVAIAGYITVILYAYLIRMLLPFYVDTFFSTYLNWGENILPKLEYLSPASSCYRLYESQSPANWLLLLALMLILLAASYALYQLRPSEAAETSIAFKASRPIIRILLVIPLTLYIALFFYMAAPEAEGLWAIFSIILFGSLLHGLIEIIFNLDIRSAFHHKKQLATCVIVCAAFFGIFIIDPLNYDNLLPSQSNVKTVYVDLPLDNDTDYVSEEYLLTHKESDVRYYLNTGITDYRLNNVALTGENISLIYNLIRDCQNTGWTENSTIRSCNLHVKFVKTSGMTETRLFTLYLPENLDTLAAVYNCQELRSTHFQIAALPYTLYNGITFTDSAMNTILRPLTQEEIEDFLAIYTKELTTATLDDQLNHPPVGAFSLLYGKNSVQMPENYIYGSFTQSLGWLKAHDINLDQWQSTMTIKAAIIAPASDEYSDTYTADENLLYEADTYPDFPLDTNLSDIGLDQETLGQATVLTDQNKIKELLPHLCLDSYAEHDYVLWSLTDQTYTIDLYFEDTTTGNISVYTYYPAPDFDIDTFIATLN